ncbi:MAG: hypothetical protein NZM31_14845 [Gemmatales bacterium]|nr:hypothetical protein [Gemmatales bacterium]MDW8388273.1 hypothetical protein [Gemmatales bacterium]
MGHHGFAWGLRHLMAMAILGLAVPEIWAGEEEGCCPVTVVRPGFTVVHVPPEPEPIWEKPMLVPAPKLFFVDQAPPRYAEVPPPPPVRFFTFEPPPVRFFTMIPPLPKLLRFEEKPPVVVDAPPRPPIRLFTVHPTPPEFLPCVSRPGVTIVSQPQPCPAECLGHLKSQH